MGSKKIEFGRENAHRNDGNMVVRVSPRMVPKGNPGAKGEMGLPGPAGAVGPRGSPGEMGRY